MATGPITQIADVIVPEVFNSYIQHQTAENSALVQSDAIIANPVFDQLASSIGSTVNFPGWNDLDNDEDNVSGDEASNQFVGGTQAASPKKITAINETACILRRNQYWNVASIVPNVTGGEPMQHIMDRMSNYWSRRLQAAFISTAQGVFADNDAAPDGTEHVQGDLTNDVSELAGGSFSAGVTDFNIDNFLNTSLLLGDAAEDLAVIMVHSVVLSKMKSQNAIEFVEKSDTKVRIPTYLNRQVVVNDSLPNSGGVYETWLFGRGAFSMGMAFPDDSIEVGRNPEAGSGGGATAIYSRINWIIHPNGHSYIGTAAAGGPSNAATTNNLANAGSWQRVYPERKQVKMARLVTREM